NVTKYTENASPGDGTHLRVSDWDVGTTESGSSGSGLWNEEHRLVGQLHGGAAACGNDLPDWFGWFHVTLDRGASASERAKDWLHHAGTGAMFVDGKHGCASPTVDFSTSSNPVLLGQPLTATSSVSGGTGPYTYAWDMNGDGQIDCTTASCTTSFDREWEGNVELAVTDSMGCRASVIRHQQSAVDPNLCMLSFDASDVPLDVPDNVFDGVTSSISVTAAGTARKAMLSLRIEHPFVGDLRVSLIAPSGRELPL